MKLVIEIPDEDYNNIEPFLNGETIKGGFNLFKALEIIKNGKLQEPCEDCISREATLDAIIKRLGIKNETYLLEAERVIYQQILAMPSVNPQKPKWIPVSERLPETDNKNSINSFNVLLWVKYKKYPEKKAQIYLGKLKRIDGDDGSGNFWGIKTETCEWTIWGWSYFYEPEVIAWMPLPEPYEAESEDKK